MLQLFGRDRESAVLGLLAVYLVSKYIRSCTWELFASYVFLYSKVTFMFLFLLASIRSCIYYTVVCFILWFVLEHPKYQGPSKLVKVRSKSELSETLQMPETEIERAGRRGVVKTKQTKDFSKIESTLLIFTAPWADNCYFTYPLWVRFANRFTTQKMKFIEIDCGSGRFDSIARSFKFNMSNI